jgi:hypothetical protein
MRTVQYARSPSADPTDCDRTRQRTHATAARVHAHVMLRRYADIAANGVHLRDERVAEEVSVARRRQQQAGEQIDQRALRDARITSQTHAHAAHLASAIVTQ